MTTPTPDPASKKKPKEKKTGRWRRRIIIALIVIVALILIFRSILTMLLPSVINKVAASYNLQCTYDRLDLHLFAGNAALWDFRVLPLEGGDPILRADYLQGDISVIGLLKGRLVVYRAAADGVDVSVERKADGTIPLLARFAPKSPATAAQPAKPAANPNAPIDLQPPLRIDALRLEHIRARFHDLYVQPNVDARVALDLRLNDLGISGEPAHFELDFSSDPILDTLRVEGKSTGDANQLNATLNVLMRGLHLKPAAGYLAALGIKPTADNITATMTGNLVASVNPNPNDGIKANLTLQNARLTSDGAEAAGLDQLTVNVDSLSAGSAKIANISINGVRASAFRNADGNLAVAGVELVPIPPQPPGGAAPPPATPTTTAPFQVTLQKFTLDGLRAGFIDQSISPPVTLALNSKQFEMDNLVANSTANFKIALESPGIVREIDVNGSANPFSPTKSFKVDVEATGINPVAVKPYLDSAGLASEWKDGKLSLAADGALTIDTAGKINANAKLSNFDLSDTTSLLSLSEARIKNAAVDSEARAISIEAIDLAGPGLRIHRDAEGNLHLLGIKTVKTKPAPTAVAVANDPPPPPATPATQPTAPFDTFQINHFGWKGINATITDDSVSPPADVAISDAGFTLDHLLLRLQKSDAALEQGKFHAWLIAPRLTSGVTIDGTITPSLDKTLTDFHVQAANLHADAVATYLKPLGVEPNLKDGSFTLQGKADLDTSASRPKISLALSNLKYADGDQPLASVSALALDGLTTTDTGVSLESISVQSPHARIVRAKDGIIEAGGMRFVLPPPAAPQTASALLPAPPPSPSTQPSTFSAALKSLKVSDVDIAWDDQLKNARTALKLDAQLTDFLFGSDAHPAPFKVLASVTGSVDNLTATGNFTAAPTFGAVEMNIDATGLRPGPGAVYFPPTIRAKMQDGKFHSTLAADAKFNPRGGQAVNVTVKDVDYRDANDDVPLMAFDTFHLAAPRLDTHANVIAVNDVTLKGFQTTIRKTATGIDMMGIELPSDVKEPDTKPAASAPPIDPPAPVPANDPPPPTTQPTTAPSSAEILHQVAAERGKLPIVTLQTLDIEAKSISLIDQTKPAAKPIVVQNLTLSNPKPISLLGSDPEANPPVETVLTGRIDPVVESFVVNTRAMPFARQKILGVDLSVSGIHGKGLVEIDPSLASMIEGDKLQNGQFNANLSAALKLQTVRPTDLDLSYGGKLDFTLNNVAFRAEPKGPVLAGIGEVHSEGIVLAPNLAGVDVHELEIDNITGRGERKADGLHVCGLIIKPPSTQPAPVVKASTAPPAPSAPPAPAPSTQPSQPNEYKIERLLVSGIDFRVEDQTCTPPAIIPINSLDLEAQNLTNLALTQDKPMRFNLLASADKVPLPVGSAGQSANRELFSQVAGSGVVSLYPNLKGWTKLSLNGFELTGIRGIAEEEKVKLGAGTFDADIDLRFPGDGSIDSSTRLVVTDLSLSEPPNGYLTRTLQLPAPLDVVIGVLQDQDGSITVPLNVTIEHEHVSGPAILSAGVGALAQIIATAIASSPLKLTGALGLNGKPDAQPPVQVTFPAGYSALGLDQMARLNALAARLHKDKSLQATLKCDSGKADVDLTKQRVNPGADDALVLATALSRRRDELLAARREAAAQVRAWLASSDADNTARGIERLRAINEQLADTESAMDHAYDLLRPGADRQAMRRTRAATLSLARDRLDAVQKYLETAGKNAVASDRIKITNPQFSEAPENQSGTVTITILKTK